MKASARFFPSLVLTAGMILAFAACEERGPVTTETRVVRAEGALSAKVSLRMGAGVLRLSGGAEELMEGRFLCNVKHWKPEISYSVSGGKGRLTVRQGKGHSVFFGSGRNKWDMHLTNTLPIDLHVSLGAGENRLDLRGLNLSSLDIQMGVGEVHLDLRGPRGRSFDVVIDGGVGSGRIVLPRDIGVRAEIHGGLGSVHARGFRKDGHIYTNDAFGKSPVVLNLKINAGIGSIDLNED